MLALSSLAAHSVGHLRQERVAWTRVLAILFKEEDFFSLLNVRLELKYMKL